MGGKGGLVRLVESRQHSTSITLTLLVFLATALIDADFLRVSLRDFRSYSYAWLTNCRCQQFLSCFWLSFLSKPTVDANTVSSKGQSWWKIER